MINRINSAITGTVALCTKRPLWIVAIALALAAGSALYASRHFAIRTDVKDLLSADLPWAQRAERFLADFPQREIIVVVDAPTPELVEQATAKLAGALREHPDKFLAVSEPGTGDFFARNGLLFLSQDEVSRITEGLARADDLLGTLAADPSLRGALDALSLALVGVDRGDIKLDDLVFPMSMAADTVEAVLAERPASFSWRALADGKPPRSQDLRRFILVRPVLDFSALEPGRAATEAISRIASERGLESYFRARVRQTGQVPIDDDEFGTITQNAAFTVTLSFLSVFAILWLALRSLRIVAAVIVSLAFGLAVSAAAGLLLVGAFNVISIAFFALFVGLGVDFAIQFSVRYRAERHEHADLYAALRSAAAKAGGPLALAAVAIAVGFASFTPTDYRGLSELGEIAGIGMIVAFLASVTLLPALLALVGAPPEPRPMGFAALAPVDRFTARHRIPIVAITLLIVAAASPLLLRLPFDFNPLHLQDPKVQSAATFRELKSDPQTGANAIELEAPDLSAAEAKARRIAELPQVARTRTLADFIPDAQDEKIKLIRDTAEKIDPSINPEKVEPPPPTRTTSRPCRRLPTPWPRAPNPPMVPVPMPPSGSPSCCRSSRRRKRRRVRAPNRRSPNRCATPSIKYVGNSCPNASPPTRFRATLPANGPRRTDGSACKFCPRATPRTPMRCATSSPPSWPWTRVPPARPSCCSRPGTPSSTPSSPRESSPSPQSRCCCW
jgi:hopanoid biosynthesis associated RND transporter like protein HpnN